MGRRIVQALTALVYNLNLKGFWTGTIYHGKLKSICVPGLNCYSCPGALGSCPIGSLQSAIGAVYYKVSFYIVGFLIFVGALLGRFICGWACPFGLIQELLHKIPSPKLRKKRAFGILKYGKYVILAVFVLLLPTIYFLQNGVSSPAFCKLICPAGTLEAGVPLVAMNEKSAAEHRLAVLVEGAFTRRHGHAVGVRLPAILPVRLPAGRDLRAVQQNIHVRPAAGSAQVHALQRLRKCV